MINTVELGKAVGSKIFCVLKILGSGAAPWVGGGVNHVFSWSGPDKSLCLILWLCIQHFCFVMICFKNMGNRGVLSLGKGSGQRLKFLSWSQ